MHTGKLAGFMGNDFQESFSSRHVSEGGKQDPTSRYRFCAASPRTSRQVGATQANVQPRTAVGEASLLKKGTEIAEYIDGLAEEDQEDEGISIDYNESKREQ